jgi:hypothetical protein
MNSNNAPKLQINLFCSGIKHTRFGMTSKLVDEIYKIKDQSSFKLCIYGEKINIQQWIEYFKGKPKINVDLLTFETSHYPDKVVYAHKTKSEYSCKVDDDILISHNLWDYIIDNLDKINDKNPIIAPILTNGIPSVELFVEDFCTSKQQTEAYELFKRGRINEIEWGLDFSKVNDYIYNLKMDSWKGYNYWEMVTNVDTQWDKRDYLPWYYYMVRGVHPARFDFEYNIFIANCILQNKEMFYNGGNYYLDTYKAPYFTNNMFFCKTSYWRKTFSLFSDGFDEGQLTLQGQLDNSNILYVRNGFGIHMAYGMTKGQAEIENYYIQNL